MPNGTKTTELVKAIERVLLEARTRITTGEIVDKVAERLPPGIPPVKRREDNPKAVIYDTVTKELAYMTGQDKRSGGENHFHFRSWIVRGYSGGYWVNLEIPGLDLHLMDDALLRTTSPALVAPTSVGAAIGRQTQQPESSCLNSSMHSLRSALGAGPTNVGSPILKSTT